MARVFRPPLWAWFATVAGSALCIAAGVWQWQRGEHKQALLLQFARVAAAAPVELAGGVPPAPLGGIAVRLRGRYDAQRQVLLDGQAHDEQPGYDVWTPLRLAAGAAPGDLALPSGSVPPAGSLILVNRGWVPAGRDRSHLPPLPAPDGPVELRGVWRSLPRPGLRLAAPACAPAGSGGWPRLLLYPTAADLQCAYGEPVADGELLLDPAEPGGFVRQWQMSFGGVTPLRNFAYAAQWFAFAAVALALFFKLNLKRIP